MIDYQDVVEHFKEEKKPKSIRERIRDIELKCHTPEKLTPENVVHYHTQLASYMSAIDEGIEREEKLYTALLIEHADKYRLENPKMSFSEAETRFRAEHDTTDYHKVKLLPKRVSKLIDSLKKLQSYNEEEFKRSTNTRIL